ncbi:hypothetical protein FF38_03280 [Lucilia cuprina]|uniref:Uncharacterized protein n=1 Tax=Lucilia cuprina TaxID=7375 RepID=A0A0L0C9X0_LUCCU|nr:hypothetical protein FF38_03280 [Lucilia cuprina]
MNVKCRLLNQIYGEDLSGKITSMYALKPLAILASQFEDIFFMDSDSLPLSDVNEIFDWDIYQQKGLIINSDFWMRAVHPSFYDIVGIELGGRARGDPNDEVLREVDRAGAIPGLSNESGQMFIKKSQHFRSLLLATYYNLYGPTCYFPLLMQRNHGEGDKDTYAAAAVVLKEDFYQTQQKPDSYGYFLGPGDYQGLAMIQPNPITAYQIDLEGKEVEKKYFALHANTLKANPPDTHTIFRVKQTGLKHNSCNIISTIKKWANKLKKSMQMDEDNSNSDWNPGVVSDAVNGAVNSAFNSAFKDKITDMIIWNNYEGLISTESMIVSEKASYYYIGLFLLLLTASSIMSIIIKIFNHAPVVIFIASIPFLVLSVINLYPTSVRTWYSTDQDCYHSKFTIPAFRYSHLYTLHITTSAITGIIFGLLHAFSNLNWSTTFITFDALSGFAFAVHTIFFFIRYERTIPDKVKIYQYVESKYWMSERAKKLLKAATVETIPLNSVSVDRSDTNTPPNGAQQVVIETPPESVQEYDVRSSFSDSQVRNESSPHRDQQESNSEPPPNDQEENNGS